MSVEGTRTCDVAIVGGGPAGLSAAIELKRLGVASVIVLEREAEAGGIPRHCGHYPFGMREFARVLRGPDYARRLVARAFDRGVEIMTRTTAVALRPGPELSVSWPDGLFKLGARRVLLATGVRERSRSARLIGGTKPGGVLSTGALQGLVYLDKLMPFRRPVILGSEFVSFSALLTCRHAGMTPVAVIEPNKRITAWRASRLLPRALGVPVLLETALTRIVGRSWVEAVEVCDGRGAMRTIETDGVIVSGDFQPEATLVRESHLAFDRLSGGPICDQYMRLSDPHYFAAGNLLRPVETAGWCWDEGRAAARMIAKSLAGELAEQGERVSIALSSDAFKYVVPQKIGSAGAVTARHLQLRVTRPVRGWVSVVHNGRSLSRHRIDARPERRILLPVVWSGAETTGVVEIALTEDNP